MFSSSSLLLFLHCPPLGTSFWDFYRHKLWDNILTNILYHRHWKDVNIGVYQMRRENPQVLLDGGHLGL